MGFSRNSPRSLSLSLSLFSIYSLLVLIVYKTCDMYVYVCMYRCFLYLHGASSARSQDIYGKTRWPLSIPSHAASNRLSVLSGLSGGVSISVNIMRVIKAECRFYAHMILLSRISSGETDRATHIFIHTERETERERERGVISHMYVFTYMFGSR